MRTKIFTLGMAALTAIFMMAAPLQAQTKQQQKDAKAAAKKLTKQGFETMGLPIVRQLEKYYMMAGEKDANGTPKYISVEEMGVAKSYSAAHMAAVNNAKVRLAGSIETAVMSEAKSKLATAQLSPTEAESITKAMEKSTLYVAQVLNNIITVQDYYAVKGDVYEVHVALAYSVQNIKDMVKKQVLQSLEEELNEFTPVHEKLINGIIEDAGYPYIPEY